jgi:hypothetical protein
MLQWYERALKALLAHSNYEVVQTDDGFRHTLDDNKEAVRNKTLGQLVKLFTGGHVLLPKADGQDNEPDLVGANELDDGKLDSLLTLQLKLAPKNLKESGVSSVS